MESKPIAPTSQVHLSTAAIPSIDTARLELRGHRREDFADCVALWTDPVVTRFISGRPSTEEEVWARLLRYVGHWAVLGFGYWVVREKGTGRFVGEVGLADFKRAIEPPFNGAPEAGWILAPWAHGRGFATEAVRAVQAWAQANLGTGRTVCMIDPQNLPSIAVANRCGYREFARTTYKGEATILFAAEPNP